MTLYLRSPRIFGWRYFLKVWFPESRFIKCLPAIFYGRVGRAKNKDKTK